MTELKDQPAWVQKIHQLNDILHKEPFDSLAYGFFWYLVLLCSAPLCSFGMIFYTAYKLVLFYVFNKQVLPKDHPDKELAVVITGCDSGFGKELVFSLVSKGFVVFAACLQKESFSQFQGEPKIIPVQVNVTSDKEVEELGKTVSKWLSEGDNKDKKRCLHALVNNAGVGAAGLSDWLKLKDFQFCMDINFIGMIRVVKAITPMFKKQAANGTYKDARIINMVSTAGLYAGGILTVAYEASKHAADCYTTNLRLELKGFGIKVTAVNPGLHKTPLAGGIAPLLRGTWDSLTPEHREEYGEGTSWDFS